jgi:hypothetical protein
MNEEINKYKKEKEKNINKLIEENNNKNNLTNK